MIELLVSLVVLAPLGGGAAAWVSDDRRAVRLAVGGLGVSIAAGLALAGIVLGSGPVRAFDGLVVVDALGAAILVLVLVVAAIALAGSPRHLDHEAAAARLRPHDRGRYYALLLWFAGGLATIPLVDSLGLVWVGIEATTIVSALLVGFARTPTAIEAAWKYLILGSIGIGFALLGTLLLYASSVGVLGETSDALAWTRLIAIAPRLDPGLARLAFIFALAGYGTKAGLVPFHTWLPDAHSQAPSPISALLSGAALAVALYALARFHLVVVGTLGPAFSSTLLVLFGLLSLAIALPFIVAQGDLKRLLAYSSIEHIGIATLALGFGGRVALLGLTLHLASHGLAKATAFLAAGQLVAERGSRRIGRLAGSLARSPADGRALVVASLALAGLPPSGIFVGELAIIFGGVQAGWGAAAAAAALILGLAVAGLLFHIVRVAVGPAGSPTGGSRSSGPSTVALAQPPGATTSAPSAPSRGWAVVLATPLAVVVIAGLWTPSPLGAALDRIVDVLAGGHG
ncbi:MAG TPA: proton-conducting transporter membrane subunit [Candidatus Limnocylindrales bacterium]|nr:proton-conducting transporter membrane subunit [Candidatus Limnocylindrales bacterium]